MQFFLRHGLSLLLVAAASSVLAAQAPTFKLGRTPSAEEIKGWDISIGVDGRELPKGSGTAEVGAAIYARKCAACHGQNLEGSERAKSLVGGQGTLTSDRPNDTVGSYWPFATAIWDYIKHSMPPLQEETLSADEVYALTALILYRNDIIGETEVMDAASLPKVQMPNRDGFIPSRVEDLPDIQKRGCKAGHCP